MEAIGARIAELPADLAPIAELARTLLDQPNSLTSNGSFQLGHRPWVAPENYTLYLFPKLPREDLARYAEMFKLDVPPKYADFLAAMNGTFCYSIALAGVPASMLGSPPLLDRKSLQCHDLNSSARLWASEHRKLPPGAFGFGHRHYTRKQNVGYFIAGDRILSILKSGKVVGEWKGLTDFLRDELKAAAEFDAELHPRPTG